MLDLERQQPVAAPGGNLHSAANKHRGGLGLCRRVPAAAGDAKKRRATSPPGVALGVC